MADQVLQQIADEAGVSVRTVYRILNGGVIQDSRPNVSKRAEKIRDIARKLHYRPNAAARAVSTGRFNCISLLISEFPRYGYMHHDLLRGILHIMSKNKMQMAMSAVSDTLLSSNQSMPSLLNQLMADGMLINYSHHHPKGMHDLIRTHNIPAVWINTDMSENCVRPDDIQGGRVAVRAAIESGRKNIQFLHYNFTFYSDDDYTNKPEDIHFSLGYRLHGYRLEMQQNGMQPVNTELCGQKLADALPTIRKWLKQSNRPDAVITSDPRTALALHTAATEAGYKLPEDMQIITFQGNLPFDELDGGILSMLIPWFGTGMIAAKKILEIIGEEDSTFPTVEIPYAKPRAARERRMTFGSLLDGWEMDEYPNLEGAL